MGRSSGAVAVRLAAAPAYELVLSMAVAASRVDTPEARAVRTAAGEDLVARVRRFASSDWMWVHVLALALDAPAPRDGAALLVALDRASAREILRCLCGYYVHWFQHLAPKDLMDAALRGEPRAIEAFVARGGGEDETWSRSLRARLEAGAVRTNSELMKIVEEWVARVEPALHPSFRRLAAAARRAPPAHAAGPGISDVLLVPSLVIRPVQHEFEHKATKLVCFPIDARAAEVPAPSPDLVAVSRALADESRLRVLMALVVDDLPAQEIADRLGLGLSTVLHHLTELRAVGLVQHGGRRRPYRIDRGGVARAAAVIGAIGVSAPR